MRAKPSQLHLRVTGAAWNLTFTHRTVEPVSRVAKSLEKDRPPGGERAIYVT